MLKITLGKKSALVIFNIAILIIVAAGCAKVPPSLSGFEYPTLTINDKAYFALIDMCVAEGINWDYDPLSQVVILKGKNSDLKLLIGSSKIIVKGVLQELRGPVLIKNSIIYCPVDLRGHIKDSAVGLLHQGFSITRPFLRPIRFIVLDAGHGGKDPGAIGRRGLQEKQVVLDVCKNIKKELERSGLKIELTRTGDRFIPLAERPGVANEKGADLFVSIHANANHSRWREGFEVYYLSDSVDDDARALAAAENSPQEIDKEDYNKQPFSLKAVLWDMIYTENRRESIELAQHICRAVSKTMSLKMLGVKGAPFVVLKGSRMPAVLVEIGYLSNSDGEKKLHSSVYRRKMAEAIASGIMDFKKYSEGN